MGHLSYFETIFIRWRSYSDADFDVPKEPEFGRQFYPWERALDPSKSIFNTRQSLLFLQNVGALHAAARC